MFFFCGPNLFESGGHQPACSLSQSQVAHLSWRLNTGQKVDSFGHFRTKVFEKPDKIVLKKTIQPFQSHYSKFRHH